MTPIIGHGLSAGAEWIRTFSSALDRQRFRGFVRVGSIYRRPGHPSTCRLRHTIELSRDGPRSRHSPRIRQRRRCKRIAEPNPRRSWEAVTPSRLDQQPAVLRGTESLLTLCWREVDSNFQYAGTGESRHSSFVVPNCLGRASLPPVRNRWFADSLLEGTRFELLVRGRGEARRRAF